MVPSDQHAMAGDQHAMAGDQRTTAGLPRRTPGVNMTSWVADQPAPIPPAPAGEQFRQPGPQQRSADAAQARLSGFQRGTRRAEGTLRSRPAGPMAPRDS
jgi:hypothetical protein